MCEIERGSILYDACCLRFDGFLTKMYDYLNKVGESYSIHCIHQTTPDRYDCPRSVDIIREKGYDIAFDLTDQMEIVLYAQVPSDKTDSDGWQAVWSSLLTGPKEDYDSIYEMLNRVHAGVPAAHLNDEYATNQIEERKESE
jgi:hypothetical protein